MKTVSRAELIEYTREYLRKHDLIQGYLPQYVMPEKSSEWWCLLWYCVRRVDHLVDDVHANEPTSGEETLKFLQNKDPYFRLALHTFLEETQEIIPQQLLMEMYKTPFIEQKHFTLDKPPSRDQYLSLIDQKTGIPMLVCAGVNGLDVTSDVVQRLVTFAGRTVQLMDDLLDLHHDLANHRLFITQEEFEILKISPDEILTNLDRIAKLRTKWFMEISLPTYETAHLLQGNSFALIVRSWIEGAWRLVSIGKSVPVGLQMNRNMYDMAHYLGVTSIPFDLLPGSELLKYRMAHRLTVTFLKRYRVFTYRKAKQLSQTLDASLTSLLCGETDPTKMDTNGLNADTRQVVEWDEILGLSVIRDQFLHIIRLAFEDEATKVIRGFNGDGTSGEQAVLLNDLANLHHTIDSDGLALARRLANDVVTGQPPTLKKVINLSFDSLAILRKHQNQFQKELVGWALNTSTQTNQWPNRIIKRQAKNH